MNANAPATSMAAVDVLRDDLIYFFIIMQPRETSGPTDRRGSEIIDSSAREKLKIPDSCRLLVDYEILRDALSSAGESGARMTKRMKRIREMEDIYAHICVPRENRTNETLRCITRTKVSRHRPVDSTPI